MNLNAYYANEKTYNEKPSNKRGQPGQHDSALPSAQGPAALFKSTSLLDELYISKQPQLPPRRHSYRHFAGDAMQMLQTQRQLWQCNRVGQGVTLLGRVRVLNWGTITVGDRVRLQAGRAPVVLFAWRGGRIDIGAGTIIRSGASLLATGTIKIGRDCSIGPYVTILGGLSAVCAPQSQEGCSTPRSTPTVIEDGVTLGSRCLVAQGVRIGQGSVIAAHSLIMEDVPANSRVAGVPGRFMGEVA